MSEMDVLFPLPDGRRNADDMGMPPNICQNCARLRAERFGQQRLTPAADRLLDQFAAECEYECGLVFERGLAAARPPGRHDDDDECQEQQVQHQPAAGIEQPPQAGEGATDDAGTRGHREVRRVAPERKGIGTRSLAGATRAAGHTAYCRDNTEGRLWRGVNAAVGPARAAARARWRFAGRHRPGGRVGRSGAATD